MATDANGVYKYLSEYLIAFVLFLYFLIKTMYSTLSSLRVIEFSQVKRTVLFHPYFFLKL